MRPTDPLYASQWHLAMIGNIEKIWNEFTGTGVSVVVYDDGVEAGHVDLAANYDASGHFSFNGFNYSSAPLASGDAHGTACAGLIGAVANNGTGGVGVAFGATITGINYLEDLQNQPNTIYDAAMQHAANFDIMSNSWAVSGQFSYDQNLNNLDGFAAIDTAHFAQISATGRGGLGTIIVQAASNDALDVGGDGSHVSRHTLTVSAVEQDGFAASYSNFGAAVLIAGPAAAVTTDRSGGAGYNRSIFDSDPLPLDYTGEFSGTSAATPVVAGVVALMLDANESLGWRDVHNILALTASQTGSAYGAAAEGFEVSTWNAGGGTQWNGGGMAYHLNYGYGLVDAFAAVRMAEAWTAFGIAPQTSANEASVVADYTGFQRSLVDFNLATGTPGLRSLSMTTTQNIEVETVYVTVDLRHDYSEDLRIVLVAPDGHEIQIFDGFLNNSAEYFSSRTTWTFGVEGLRGYSSAGTWSVRFEDYASGDSGIVFDAQLEFFGAAASVNDVFHYTSDFLAAAALEPGRRVLDDTNGGVDWANFAVMERSVVANMSAGGAVSVGGVQWVTFAQGTAEIENFMAGDGADRITGNDLANQLRGMRGSDILNGAMGNDRLLGGKGSDRLLGALGNDTLTGGAQADEFVFGKSFGRDRIVDFANNIDSLHLDDVIWGGGKTVAQLLAQHASVVAGNTLLSFGAHVITVAGLADSGQLIDDIVIF
jgi:subtilisin-like proprotein convertase family protein